eukprot:sb/3463290/
MMKLAIFIGVLATCVFSSSILDCKKRQRADNLELKKGGNECFVCPYYREYNNPPCYPYSSFCNGYKDCPSGIDEAEDLCGEFEREFEEIIEEIECGSGVPASRFSAIIAQCVPTSKNKQRTPYMVGIGCISRFLLARPLKLPVTRITNRLIELLHGLLDDVIDLLCGIPGLLVDILKEVVVVSHQSLGDSNKDITNVKLNISNNHIKIPLKLSTKFLSLINSTGAILVSVTEVIVGITGRVFIVFSVGGAHKTFRAVASLLQLQVISSFLVVHNGCGEGTGSEDANEDCQFHHDESRLPVTRITNRLKNNLGFLLLLLFVNSSSLVELLHGLLDDVIDLLCGIPGLLVDILKEVVVVSHQSLGDSNKDITNVKLNISNNHIKIPLKLSTKFLSLINSTGAILVSVTEVIVGITGRVFIVFSVGGAHKTFRVVASFLELQVTSSFLVVHKGCGEGTGSEDANEDCQFHHDESSRNPALRPLRQHLVYKYQYYSSANKAFVQGLLLLQKTGTSGPFHWPGEQSPKNRVGEALPRFLILAQLTMYFFRLLVALNHARNDEGGGRLKFLKSEVFHPTFEIFEVDFKNFKNP